MNGKDIKSLEELVGHFIEFKETVKERLDRIEKKADKAANLAESIATTVKSDMQTLKDSINSTETELKNQGKTFTILAQIPKVARIIISIFVAFGGLAVVAFLINNWSKIIFWFKGKLGAGGL